MPNEDSNTNSQGKGQSAIEESIAQRRGRLAQLIGRVLAQQWLRDKRDQKQRLTTQKGAS